METQRQTLTGLMDHRRGGTITMADVRLYHGINGGFFFARATMRFFGSKIESRDLLNGGVFITSEKASLDSSKRIYNVRSVDNDFNISTLASGFSTKAAAWDYIKAWRLGGAK